MGAGLGRAAKGREEGRPARLLAARGGGAPRMLLLLLLLLLLLGAGWCGGGGPQGCKLALALAWHAQRAERRPMRAAPS